MQFNVVMLLLMIVSSIIIAQINSDQDIDSSASVAFHQGLEDLKDLLGVLNTSNHHGEGDLRKSGRDVNHLTPAQDRQLIVPAGEEEFDLFFLERKYSQLMQSLPSLIDQARAVITKSDATRNMLGYTVIAGFITGATLDSLALVLLEPASLGQAVSLIVTDKYYQGLLHWVWWYAFGYSGPNMFPGTFFGSGHPSLTPSSRDFFSLVSAHNLSLNIRTFTDLSPVKAKLRILHLRRDFSVTFRPLTSRSQHVEAELLTETFNQMISLVSFHSQLSPGGGPAPGETDSELLDGELSRLWSELSRVEEEVRTEVKARRAETATINIFVALLNLGGLIGGVVMTSGIVSDRPDELLSENLSDVLSWLLEADPPRPSKYVRNIGAAALVMAPVFWGYSYVFPYLLFLEAVEPQCQPAHQIYAKLVVLVVFCCPELWLSQVRGPQVSGGHRQPSGQQDSSQVETGPVVEGDTGQPPLSPQHRGGLQAGGYHSEVQGARSLQDRILGRSVSFNKTLK